MNSDTKQAIKETVMYAVPVLFIIVAIIALGVSLFAPAHTFINC